MAKTKEKKLVIVESPAKERTISKYLGSDYKVKASVGHIRDLPKSNKNALDIEGGFIPHYEIVKGKEKVVSDIKKEAKKSNEVILATDPDREGEAIAWHIAEAAELGNKKGGPEVKRVAFHEITKDAILKALEEPREINIDLKEAQEARRVLDRLFGYDLSALIWKKVRYGLSAGRVQSPALRILVERERIIKAFKPEQYWVLTATVKPNKGDQFEVVCSKEPRGYKEVEEIINLAKKGDWVVVDVVEKKALRKPRAPFITSTLQQTASSRLGFSPSRAMGVAQKLYEAGLITYMRTDSTTLSAQAESQIQKVVEKEYGSEYYKKNTYSRKSKNAQEAHEAIRPTDFSKKTAGSNQEQKKLYELIWRRTVSSQMKEAEVMRTKVITSTKNADIPEFSINGSRILFPGWLSADIMSRGEEVELPKVKKDEDLKLIDILDEEKETQPPSRYTEASLIKELEKRGIGRPSTYASIMKTLEDRGYVEKDPPGGKALKPTDTGEVVSEFLEKNFENYISDSFTAKMEDKLDDIALGKETYFDTLNDFYKPFSKEVKDKDSAEKITDLGEADESMKCPECRGAMIIKLSKNGKFLSCKKFPDCAGARTMEGEIIEGDKEIGENCPKCKEGKLVEKHGKFGKFIACNRYPKCKYIRESEEEKKKKATGVKCPECNKGEMVERRGRFGVFYSCSEYPKCKYAIKAKPTGEKCPECGALMMQGTKTIPERCSDKSCPNHNPHKLQK